MFYMIGNLTNFTLQSYTVWTQVQSLMRHRLCQNGIELHGTTPYPAAVIKQPPLAQGQGCIGGCCHPTPGSQGLLTTPSLTAPLVLLILC